MFMIRKFLILSMALALVWTSVGCGSASSGDPYATAPKQQATETVARTNLADGEYPVQQATYNDGEGEYTLVLLNTPPGSSQYRVTNLKMARLTDDEIKAGKKSYLKVENGEPALYLTEDFKIEYVHNVTETRTNPQTGQPEVVVVRQESNFWTPFLGALAGQAVANYLFRPQYYMPPVYQPGVPLRGYGSYGNTYTQAVESYRTRHNTPPAEVRNRQTFRTTGRLRSPSASQPRVTNPPRTSQGNRSTGSGYGASNLRRNDNPSRYRGDSRTRFGSGTGSRTARPRSSFGSARRR
jgi:hypothetical protein